MPQGGGQKAKGKEERGEERGRKEDETWDISFIILRLTTWWSDGCG